MANLDAIAHNLDALREQVEDLVAHQDAQGIVQEENQGRLQQVLQQRGHHPEVASLRSRQMVKAVLKLCRVLQHG